MTDERDMLRAAISDIIARVGIVRVWTRGTPGDEAELPDNLIVEVTSKWRD